VSAAKRLFKRIAVCIERGVADTGDVDVHQVRAILYEALAVETDRAAIMHALAEYLAAAVNGTPILLDAWNPARPTAHHHRAKH
jgi:hypothetical protein